MSKHSVVVMGLPGSGKTTFLAALWHLVSEKEVPCKLTYVSLQTGNVEHLHEIASKWRAAKKQERTAQGGDKLVSMILKAEGGDPQTVTFPDVAGEAFLKMWGLRECDETVAGWLKEPGVLLFIHADKVTVPKWVIDEKLIVEEMGIPRADEAEKVVDWSPDVAPTQVQLVDLLQSMQTEPLDVGPRRLAIILSAWDKAASRGFSPEVYLAKRMPLLDQFLRHGLHPDWEKRIYGVSAQGGDYDDDNTKLAAAERLRDIDVPSERISVVYSGGKSNDLTEPLQWLLT
jgi:GTPase SAR1 family protein